MRKDARQSILKLLKPKEGVPVLGHLVWWDAESVQIEASKFRELWIESGLQNSLCVEVRSRTALVKALKELEKGKLIRRIVDDESQLVYAIVREDIDSVKRDVEYEKENRVIYDKFTKELEFKVSGSIPDSIRAQFEQYESQYTTREVRKIVTRTIKYYGAITVRRSGGIYFMPGHTKQLNALFHVFKSLPGSCDFVALGIPDDQVYKDQLLDAAKKELLGDFGRAEGMNKKMLHLVEQGRVRPKSLETRLTTLGVLQKKVLQYQKIGLDINEFEGKLKKSVVDPIEKALQILREGEAA